jgi:hypothetical protein
MGTAVAAAVDPTGRILYPAYQAIRGLLSAQKSASTGFSKEEIEGARRFATLAKTQRVFLFDNFHFWDPSSLEFARKAIASREPLGIYVVVVWTEHDVVESVNPFQDVLSIIPRGARFRFFGMEENDLREKFLSDLPEVAARQVLKTAGTNIPLVKTLAQIARKHPEAHDLARRIESAAVELKVDSLLDVPRIDTEQKALGCVAAIGQGANVREIACALDVSVEEATKILDWGAKHGLIDILETDEVAFVHDLYQRLFDVDEILDSAFLQKINVCCALGIPDEYEKRAAIAARGQDKDLTLALVISLLRQKILGWNEAETSVAPEMERIAGLLGGRFTGALGSLSSMLDEALHSASEGQFEKAAWAVNVSGICAHPFAYLEEAVLFAHFAYLSRNNALRASAIERLEAQREASEGEAERSFIVSTMLAYGLSLDNRLKEATAVFATEEMRLASSSDRFKSAPFYLAVSERMSLACYDNSIARRRLERAFLSFQRLHDETGRLKRPDELLKCASNLCSAYVIAGMPERAEEVLTSVETATQGIDFTWSTAPSLLANNAMVAAIHRGSAQHAEFASSWIELARQHAHVRMPFLVNALGCFLEAETDKLGDLTALDVSDALISAVEADPDGEAFMSYMAYFTAWQASLSLGLEGQSEKLLERASSLVEDIPYVNGDHFRTRHHALVSSVPTSAGWRNSDWTQASFGPLSESDLPAFYQRIAHFNPLEHWLPN